jgi:DNA primase
MIDQSNIDLVGVAERYTHLKKASSYNGGEWRGACPVCGGKDRFHVWPNHKDGGRVWCRQCGLSGDAIKLVMLGDGVDFKEACDRLGIRLDGKPAAPRPQRSERTRPVEKPAKVLDMNKPCFEDAYQLGASRFVTDSMDNLARDKAAQWYLTEKRHISRGNQEWACLGWNPSERWEQWGSVKVWLPRGIVIPWMIDDVFWRIRFRALNAAYEHYTVRFPDGREMKYPQVKGAADGLYFAGRSTIIETDDTAVMVEGEFDALALQSNAPYLLEKGLKVIATGGTNNARALRWIALLSVAKSVYLAFDAGESAGPLAAVWWGSVLPNARRLIPTRHDITDMVSAGENLYEWLGYYRPTQPAPQPEQMSMFGSSQRNHYRMERSS